MSFSIKAGYATIAPVPRSWPSTRQQTDYVSQSVTIQRLYGALALSAEIRVNIYADWEKFSGAEPTFDPIVDSFYCSYCKLFIRLSE